MKNFLVIGGSSGIGAALTQLLSEQNNRIFATFNTTVEHSVLQNVTYHQLNVLDDSLLLDFLPENLDGVVYCPGAIELKPFARIQPENFITDFNLQVLGAIKIAQLTLPLLKKVNIPHSFSFQRWRCKQAITFIAKLPFQKEQSKD